MIIGKILKNILKGGVKRKNMIELKKQDWLELKKNAEMQLKHAEIMIIQFEELIKLANKKIKECKN